MNVNNVRCVAWLLLTGWGLTLQPGCGSRDTGPRQYDVSGTVSYNGEPLQSGRITFTPDYDKGNQGPPGYAIIRNGTFDTQAPGGKSSISGPLTVLITGFDTSAEEGAEPKEPLFDGFPVSAEIDPDKRRTTLDFEVPLIEKKKKR